MGDMVFDAVDKRSSASSAPEPMKIFTAPGTMLAAAAMVSFIVCLAGFAMRQVGVGVGAASVALLAAGGALSWRTAHARQLRDAQRIA